MISVKMHTVCINIGNINKKLFKLNFILFLFKVDILKIAIIY